MKIITENYGDRYYEVSVPQGYIAAVNLPPEVTAEIAFNDRNTWADYLFLGPMRIVSKYPIKSCSLVRVEDLDATESQ